MLMRKLSCATFAALLLTATSAQATWSAAVLNRSTGTIAVAGASCSYMVYGISEVIPGKGVIIVQAASNEQARADAAVMLEKGDALTSILNVISKPESPYAPNGQQYAMLSFQEFDRPVNYTGSEVAGAKGVLAGPGFSVQANTMVSDEVVKNVGKVLEKKKQWKDDLDMARELMRALAAGASAGGDSRCEGTNSTTAFISLHKKTDHARVPWLTLAMYGMQAGKGSALPPLTAAFENWLKHDTANPSTRVFIIPKP